MHGIHSNHFQPSQLLVQQGSLVLHWMLLVSLCQMKLEKVYVLEYIYIRNAYTCDIIIVILARADTVEPP